MLRVIRKFAALLAVPVLLAAASRGHTQVVTCYSPTVAYAPPPVVAYSPPPVVAYSPPPVVAYAPPAVAYAPAPVVASSSYAVSTYRYGAILPRRRVTVSTYSPTVTYYTPAAPAVSYYTPVYSYP